MLLNQAKYFRYDIKNTSDTREKKDKSEFIKLKTELNKKQTI